MSARGPTPPPPPAASHRGTVLATGSLDGDRIVIRDAAQAARLHSRGSIGVQGQDGTLALTIVEAAWSLAEGRLEVADVSAVAKADAAPAKAPALLSIADLLSKGSAGGHRTEADYLAYRDLRERGLVVRPTRPGAFAVWPRGTDQGEPAFHVRACSDADGLALADLVDAAQAKDVLSVVDADGALTHYQAGLAQPAGDVPEGDLPRAKGAVLADRVLVTDPQAADAYHRREFLGTPHPGGLLLSFVEAEALRRRGVLSVPAGLAERSAEAARVLPIHAALRAKGAVPKSGFRFGTHLRAYRTAPDDGHAEWLVHCALDGETLPWSALSRGVRLAHGVRKAFLIAVPRPDGPLFAQLTWHRP